MPNLLSDDGLTVAEAKQKARINKVKLIFANETTPELFFLKRELFYVENRFTGINRIEIGRYGVDLFVGLQDTDKELLLVFNNTTLSLLDMLCISLKSLAISKKESYLICKNYAAKDKCVEFSINNFIKSWNSFKNSKFEIKDGYYSFYKICVYNG